MNRAEAAIVMVGENPARFLERAFNLTVPEHRRAPDAKARLEDMAAYCDELVDASEVRK